MIRNRIRCLTLILCFAFAPHLSAAEISFNSKLESIETSTAYRAYQKRPKSELSKIIYLIDRFQKADMHIRYDGIDYPAGLAARLARWFLAAHYKDETARKWIMLWCNESYVTRELVWVKDAEGNCKLSREILLEELKLLDDFDAKTLATVKDPLTE